jgi:hypothetical protein
MLLVAVVILTQLPVAFVAGMVAQNEALYKEIDVTYTSEYRLAMPFGMDGQLRPHFVLNQIKTTRVVLQKGMHRIAYSTQTITSEKATTRWDISAFDGDKTRIRDGKDVNAFDGPKPLWREGYFPHLWAMAPLWDNYPLSVYLAGGERWEKLDRDLGNKGRKLSSKVLDGSATVAGEPCVVVRCEVARPPRPGVSSARVFWLATNKNYLPIKTEKYLYGYTEKFPIETVVCKDFRELRKGIWLPYHMTKTVYDEFEARSGQKLISNTTISTVTNAKLEPHLERAFFQDVKPEK